MKKWLIYLYGRKLGEIYYDEDDTKEYVYSTLVENEGFPSDITVFEEK